MSEGEAQAPAVDKRARTEEVVQEILGHMGVAARVEVKDVEGESPSLSVAVFPEEELPGAAAGRRSQVVDALQFLLNKIVNRGPDKKWINVGVGGHPEPRGPKEKREPRPPRGQAAQAPSNAPAQPQPSQPAAQAPAAATAPAAEGPQRRGRKDRQEKREGGRARGGGADAAEEALAEVPDDPALAALGRALAQKAAALGRVYAVTAMAATARAQLSRGAEGQAGLRLKAEGEGRHRRVVFLPDEPRPMPKKSAMPDYDEEDDEG